MFVKSKVLAALWAASSLLPSKAMDSKVLLARGIGEGGNGPKAVQKWGKKERQPGRPTGVGGEVRGQHTKYFGHIPLNMVALPNGGSLLSQGIRLVSRCLWEIILAMAENN